MITRSVSLLERNLHDLFGDALDFNIHLQRSNAFSCAGYLKVHVAEVIFVAEDVGKYREALAFFDQTHSDTGNRCFKRHARIHHRKAATAD